MTEEVKESNAYDPDLAIDIHTNAGGGDGAEVYYHNGGGKGQTLANNIINEIVKTGQNSRGIKTRSRNDGKDYYAFIRETKAPAVIVECAFIDTDDIKIIDTDTEQYTMGKAIAHGVLKTLGIEVIEKLYKVQVGAFKNESNAVTLVNKLLKDGYKAIIITE